MIRERVNAGIARAKADGKRCGRPFIDATPNWKGASVRPWLPLGAQACRRLPSSSASAPARCSGWPAPKTSLFLLLFHPTRRVTHRLPDQLHCFLAHLLFVPA